MAQISSAARARLRKKQRGEFLSRYSLYLLLYLVVERSSCHIVRGKCDSASPLPFKLWCEYWLWYWLWMLSSFEDGLLTRAEMTKRWLCSVLLAVYRRSLILSRLSSCEFFWFSLQIGLDTVLMTRPLSSSLLMRLCYMYASFAPVKFVPSTCLRRKLQNSTFHNTRMTRFLQTSSLDFTPTLAFCNLRVCYILLSQPRFYRLSKFINLDWLSIALFARVAVGTLYVMFTITSLTDHLID